MGAVCSRVENREFPMVRGIIIGIVSASLTNAAAPQQIASYRHRALGVYDRATGDPVEGAGVIDVATGTTARTSATGTVDLAFLPDGGALIRVRKLGYQQLEQFVRISPADTAPVTLLLVSETTVLPAVVARDSASRYRGAAMKDFEARRVSGRGQFITEEFLRKHPTRSMPDLIRGFSGLTVLCTRTGFYRCEAVASRSPRRPSSFGGVAGECRFAVFIDGVSVRDPDLANLVVTDFAGIEAYTAGQQIPARFNKNGNPCGALIFWSRER
jgi:hypothetical protein